MKCSHQDRKEVPGVARRMYCLTCEREFTPRGLPIRHGTVEGFQKHRRIRNGRWAWPACEKCKAANAQWQRDYNLRPEAIKARRVRAAARVAALAQLRKQYPAAYAAAYVREMERRDSKVVRQQHEVFAWDDVVARLVKAATGMDEATAENRLRMHVSGREEREVMREVRRLRVMLADLSKRQV